MVGFLGQFHFGVIVQEMMAVGLAVPSLFSVEIILCQAAPVISDRVGYDKL